MPESPLVSVITPMFNAEKYIAQTIDSVLSQTYTNWEMLIVDNASTDKSAEVVSQYSDPRIKLISLETNSGGPTKPRNVGIEHARGAYIALLDADDLWLQDKLQVQVTFMEENDLVLSYASFETMDANNNFINIRLVKPRIQYHDMLRSNHIGSLTAIYNAEKLGKRFFRDIDYEDYVLWLEILRDVGETKGVRKPLAKYRIHSSSVSANKLKVMKWQWRVYRDVLSLGIVASAYNFVWYMYYALIKRS